MENDKYSHYWWALEMYRFRLSLKFLGRGRDGHEPTNKIVSRSLARSRAPAFSARSPAKHLSSAEISLAGEEPSFCRASRPRVPIFFCPSATPWAIDPLRSRVKPENSYGQVKRLPRVSREARVSGRESEREREQTSFPVHGENIAAAFRSNSSQFRRVSGGTGVDCRLERFVSPENAINLPEKRRTSSSQRVHFADQCFNSDTS